MPLVKFSWDALFHLSAAWQPHLEYLNTNRDYSDSLMGAISAYVYACVRYSGGPENEDMVVSWALFQITVAEFK